MASVSEQLIAEIESLFGQLRENSFDRKVASSIPYEAQKNNEQINPEGFLAPGAISDPEIFASTIRPVIVVGALPTLPDPDYPEGSTVVLTTTGVLYRNFGGTWTAAVGSAAGGISIVGALPTLPDAAYPSGSVVFLTTDDKLYRNDDGSWSKAVDGADLIADSVTTNAILAGQITTAKLAASAVTAEKIAAGVITAEHMVANTLTAGTIAAGAIGAEQLAASIVLASIFKTASSGNRVEFDSTGISVYDASDTIIVRIPTDGSSVYVNADIQASTLTVTGTATFAGDDNAIVPTKELILEGSVTAPTQAPVVENHVYTYELDQADGVVRGLKYDTDGGSAGTTDCAIGLVLDPTDLWKVSEWKMSDQTIDRTTTLAGILPSTHQAYGIVHLGTHWYVTLRLVSAGTFHIFKFNRSDGSAVGSVDITADFFDWGGVATVPPISTDGTSLFVAGKASASKPKVVTYDTSMAVTASVTLDHTDAHVNNTHPREFEIVDISDGNGTCFWVKRYNNSYDVVPGFYFSYDFYFQAFNTTTGAPITETEFRTPNGEKQGFFSDGSYFYSAGDEQTAPVLSRYSNWVNAGYTADDYTTWWGYSWYDSVGTTHETDMGPTVGLFHLNRHNVSITMGPLPGAGGADEPNSRRMYAAFEDPEPAASVFDLQQTTAVNPFVLTLNTVGAAPNGGTPFAAASSRANIHADDDSIWINAQDDGPHGSGRALEADDASILDLLSDAALITDLVTEEHLTVPTTSGGAPGGNTGAGLVEFLDTTKGVITIGDGEIARPVTPIGFQAYALQEGAYLGATYSTAANLATVVAGNGGALLVPIVLVAPMLVEGIAIWSTDTASARNAEWELYYQPLESGTNLIAVDDTNLKGTFSFTPGAASRRASAAVSATMVPPGQYFVAIRNTNTSRTFGVGADATAGSGLATVGLRTDTSHPALDASIPIGDFAALTSRTAGVLIQGQTFGETGSWG